MEINSFRGQYGFLSNFHPAKTVFEGVEYPTSEHAFQAAKFSATSVININPDFAMKTRLYVRDLASAADAKHFAKEMYNQGKTRMDWLSVRDSVMFIVLHILLLSLDLSGSAFCRWEEEEENWL